MSQHVPVREESDIEHLYSQARNYDLLNRDQEQEIDGQKWMAVHDLLEAMVRDPCSRHYLARLTKNCCQPLPAIEAFRVRKHRLLLRRELADHLPGGTQAADMIALADDFRKPYSEHKLVSGLVGMSLPGSFVVGIAETLLNYDDRKSGNKVSAALRAWELHWPREYADVTALSSDTAKTLENGVRRYVSARDRLIKHNLRLVFTIAGRHRDRGVALLDLVQEGNLGLLRAAEKFEFERGFRFSTYAFNWITQAIKRYLADAAGTIRYPTHIQEQLGKVYRERARGLEDTGIVPSDTQLAGALGLSVEKARELLQLRNFGMSIDTPKFEDEGSITLLDSMPGGPFSKPEDTALLASLNQRLLNEIRHLDKAEQQVVIRRWGLQAGPPLTRSEIADQMSVSREWVRQLEKSALKKLGQSDTMQAVFRDHIRS